jgi:hypothetical protein
MSRSFAVAVASLIAVSASVHGQVPTQIAPVAILPIVQQGQQQPPRPAPAGQVPGGTTATTPAPPSQQGQGQGGQGRGSVPIAPGQATTSVRPERIPTQNVKVELTITDTFGGVPTKKTVTMLVADGWSGRIRSQTNIASDSGGYAIMINVDCTPTARDGGRIQLNLTFDYVPDMPLAPSGSTRIVRPANINESMTVLVNDGKATMISQSADPGTDRKVTVEVMATVVK